MKKAVLAIILLVGSYTLAVSQGFYDFKRNRHWIVYAGTGVANYYGDIKDKFGDITVQPNIVLGVKRRYHPHIMAAAEFTWYRLKAEDERLDIETGKPFRNLSFRSDNIELQVLGIANLYPTGSRYYKRRLINPIAFAGVGFTYFNPKANLDGTWHALQPLETEGESYARVTPIINVGLGVTIMVNPFINVTVDGGYRFTFTDYLDDASGPDYRDLDSFTDPIAAALSDRRDPEFVGTAVGGVRGNPDNNDGYFLLNAKFEYYLPPNLFNGRYKQRRRRRPAYR